MGVNIDETGRDDLAARVDGFGSIRRDACLHRRDATVQDRHVAHGVEPQCGIDDTPTLDNQVVVGRGGEHARCAGEHRSTRGGC